MVKESFSTGDGQQLATVTRRESVSSVDRLRADSDPHVFNERPQRDHNGNRGREAALQAARRADADQVTHDEPKIEPTRMNQEALQDIGSTRDGRSSPLPAAETSQGRDRDCRVSARQAVRGGPASQISPQESGD